MAERAGIFGNAPQAMGASNAAMGRTFRRPKHSFYLHQIPFTLQPFVIAPVIPGDTLESALIQYRCVTDPVKNPVIGWWHEMYLFYVKLRDLDDRETYSNMMIDPGTNLSGLTETDDTVSQYFGPVANSEMNWVEKCLKRVTEDYFRGISETWNNITIGGLPVVSIVGNSFLDSFINDDAYQTAIEPTVDTSGASIGITVIEAAMRNWQQLRLDNMTDWTFEQYCAAYGINMPMDEVPHRPELLRFTRNWQYPSNTIDPTSGAPVSAVSWAGQERVDKARFFKEPGFIFGCSVIRAKVYFGNQSSSASTILSDAMSWLPPNMLRDPEASLREFTAGTGPLKANTDDYWLDVKDLFLHGDQFLNVSPATAGINAIALPTAGGEHRYPTNQAMLDTLTVSANAVAKCDGIVSFNIKSRLYETT